MFKRNFLRLCLLALVLGGGPVRAEEGHDHAHGEEHGHEEGGAEIAPAAAEKAGIKTAKAGPGVIGKEIVLSGRIVLNGDTSVSLPARYPGRVREVPVKLGQAIEAGQILAVIDSNASLQDFTLESPVSGTLLERNTNVGDVVDGSRPLFVVADLTSVWAKFHIFPKDAASIRQGQDIRIHTFDHTLEAGSAITLFLPTADALSQTHLVIAPLDNKDGQWKPGLSIDGHVAVSEEKAAIVIPKSALQTMEEAPSVFVRSGDRYEARAVKTGREDGRSIEIVSGLKAGEEYVSEGSFTVKADILKSGAAHEH